MDCLLERSYHVQTHTPAVVNPTLKFERFDLGHFVPTAKSLHLVSWGASSNTVCTDYVELFSMNVNLKMFCILSLCIILCDASKASENLTFVLKQSYSVECFCCHHLLSGCHEDQRLCRTNYIRFISKL